MTYLKRQFNAKKLTRYCLYCEQPFSTAKRNVPIQTRPFLVLIQYLEGRPMWTKLLHLLYPVPLLKLQVDYNSKTAHKVDIIVHNFSFCSLAGQVEIWLETSQVKDRKPRLCWKREFFPSRIAQEGNGLATIKCEWNKREISVAEAASRQSLPGNGPLNQILPREPYNLGSALDNNDTHKLVSLFYTRSNSNPVIKPNAHYRNIEESSRCQRDKESDFLWWCVHYHVSILQQLFKSEVHSSGLHKTCFRCVPAPAQLISLPSQHAVKLCRNLLMTHLFKSGVWQKGDIKNEG